MIPEELKKLTDLELVKRYKRTRKKEIIGELYIRYRHLVFGTCLKLLKDQETCKDVTMDIFEYLMEDLPNRKVISFKYWLHKLTMNKCYNYLRTNHSRWTDNEEIEKKMKKSDEIFMENRQFSTLIYREDYENSEFLDEAMKSLKEEQQNCIILFYWKKKTYKEIARTTGLDLNQVKSHIQNGKRKLGIYLSKKSG